MKKFLFMLALFTLVGISFAQLGVSYDLERRYYIQGSANDAEQIGRTLVLNSRTLEFQDDTVVGLRYTGVDVLQPNQRIYRAELRFKSATTSLSNGCTDIFVKGSSSNDPFTATSPVVPRTTQSPVVSFIACNWYSGQRGVPQTIDVTRILQAQPIDETLVFVISSLANDEPGKSVYSVDNGNETIAPVLILYIDEVP